MDNKELVTAIKWHRENLEIKAKDVAAMLGHVPSKYSKIENGEQVITGVELVKIADYFGMTVDELVKVPSRRK
ncbi:helix-turn-helix domain-containing protein [Macrococcus equipercicus]|uniref:Helix-turn-helix transcriptional regulator n=1 Tax=Macrococcus equipercicus TaxID=69967 RepID=A0A9Q9BSN9_9STAP|nr:helix-turn-helix transcriptional regulator [Macrococcus equipercicus]UTH13251.1 helix-turn-helix transcriptional regulator [Macrococcus equipercicus]